MALVMTTVTGDLTFVDSSEVEGATVTFGLSSNTVDEAAAEIVLKKTISAVTEADGTFSVSLWPNTRGREATTYQMTVRLQGANNDIFTTTGISVPETGTANIADLMGQVGARSYDVVYLTAAQLTANLAADPNYMAGKYIYVLEDA